MKRIGLALFASAVAFAATLLDVTMLHMLETWDQEVARTARASLSPWVRYELAHDWLSWPGNDSVIWAVGFGAAVVCLFQRRWRAGALIATTLFLGMMSVFALKDEIGRIRPGGNDGAFPSGHAASVVLSYGLVVMLAAPARSRRWLIPGWLALAAIVGVARVMSGVHWPTDVLGGWALGAAWVSLAAFMEGRLEGRSSRRLDARVPQKELPSEPAGSTIAPARES